MDRQTRNTLYAILGLLIGGFLAWALAGFPGVR